MLVSANQTKDSHQRSCLYQGLGQDRSKGNWFRDENTKKKNNVMGRAGEKKKGGGGGGGNWGEK